MKDLILSLGKDGLKSAYSLLQEFALYLTLAIAVIIAICYLVLRLRKSDNLARFKTLALGVAIGYSVTLISCILFFMVARMHVKAELDTNYFLIFGFLVLLLAYAVSMVITSFISKKAFKITNLIGVSLAGIYTIILIALLPTVDSAYVPLSSVEMYIFTALVVIAIALITIFMGKDKGTASQTKTIAYASVCISLSFALSFVKFFTMGANGGSITLASLLPLMIFSYCFGARKGVFAGVIYGVLQCLQNPQIYQPVQILLDYPIAFGAIGVAGCLRDFNFTKNNFLKFALGATIAVTLRYVSHVLSGYYVFSSWAWEGWGALAYSVVYNLFCFVDLAVILIPAFFLFNSKSFTKQLGTINPR